MNDIDPEHPRAESLKLREKVAEGLKMGIVTPEGLSAHGRGEAFDYILGEETTEPARRAIEVSAAMSVLAENPVFSVNGNVAALVPEQIAELEARTNFKIEVNLYHKSREREERIAKYLREKGVSKVLGSEKKYSAEVPGIKSNRKIVDSRGIKNADLIIVPLEDGDRTEALVEVGKTVVAIDLNPMSRTSKAASVTIVDNLVRALPKITEKIEIQSSREQDYLKEIVKNYNNEENLRDMFKLMLNNLKERSED